VFGSFISLQMNLQKTYQRRSGKRNILFRELQFAKVAVVYE
jgi:hypothetical protein